jgi:fatty acid-binding protein DegV
VDTVFAAGLEMRLTLVSEVSDQVKKLRSVIDTEQTEEVLQALENLLKQTEEFLKVFLPVKRVDELIDKGFDIRDNLSAYKLFTEELLDARRLRKYSADDKRVLREKITKIKQEITKYLQIVHQVLETVE